MTEQGRRGLSNVGRVLAGQGVNTLALLLAAVVLPRLLGPVDYGRFATVSAVVSVLFIVSTLGLVAAEVRFISPLRRAGDRRATAELTSSIWGVRLAGSLAAALACLAWLSIPVTDLGFRLAAATACFALSRYVFQGTRSLLLPLGRAGAYGAYQVAGSVLFVGAFYLGYLLSGLVGGFVAATVANGLLFLAAWRAVATIVPLSPRLIRGQRLEPLLRYNVLAFVGSIANGIRFWVPVWLVAAASGPRQAGFFGLAMQVLAIVIGLASAAQQALMPILAELDTDEEVERLAVWHGWMARYGAAVLVCAAIAWSFVGQPVLRLALGTSFEPAFGPILLILVAAPLLVSGSANNSLHFVRERPLAAALNLGAAALVTIGGVGVAVRAGSDLVATRAAVAILVAAALFWTTANLSVYLAERRWVGTFQSLLLLAPLAILWVAPRWPEGLPLRTLAGTAVVAVYLIVMFRLGALSRGELLYVWSLRRAPGSER